MDGAVQRRTITTLCVGENGVSSVKWSDYENWPSFSGVPAGQETCQRTGRAFSNLSLFMWCVSAKRKQSGASEALIDLSEAITTSNEQKIGRQRFAVSSVSRITRHRRTLTCQRARPASDGRITAGQVRRESTINDDIQKHTADMNLLHTHSEMSSSSQGGGVTSPAPAEEESPKPLVTILCSSVRTRSAVRLWASHAQCVTF